MKANAAQASGDWLLARAGCFTASRSADLMAKLRDGKPGASRGRLLALLAVERLTGRPVTTYQNAAMLRGIELEGEARDAYSFTLGVAVVEAGFIPHPTIPFCGCSPDGLVGDDGMVEIKCPDNMEKHLDALRSGAHADEYRWQLQHQLWVCGREWVDAVSYHPDFPEGLQLAVKRVARDASAIAEIEAAVIAGNDEVAGIVLEMESMRGAA